MSSLDDPRVLFAAERTLLAWCRTAVAMVTLGFVVERFGLFLQQLNYVQSIGQRNLSFTIGLSLIIFAVLICLLSILQFRRIVKQLSPHEIPTGYWLWFATLSNIGVAFLGALLIFYQVRGVLL